MNSLRETSHEEPKKSANLADFFDFPVPTNGVSLNPQGDIELEFASPDDAAFFRVEVE